jgi:ribonuclease HII
MLRHEQALWARGLTRVAGVDEAGRGPLAGPVVAAAVVFEAAHAQRAWQDELRALTDSKKITAKRRDLFFDLLTQSAGVQYAVVEVDAAEIDRLNILRATHAAMGQALRSLAVPPEWALVDGLPVPGLPCEAEALVGGDGLSLSIAAASVLAKVTRDRAMQAWHAQYPVYGFDRHKGYGTRQHLEALRAHGPCPLHRRSFAPVRRVCGE